MTTINLDRVRQKVTVNFTDQVDNIRQKFPLPVDFTPNTEQVILNGLVQLAGYDADYVLVDSCGGPALWFNQPPRIDSRGVDRLIISYAPAERI